MMTRLYGIAEMIALSCLLRIRASPETMDAVGA